MDELTLYRANYFKDSINTLKDDICKLEKLEYLNICGADRNKALQIANIRIGYIIETPDDDEYDKVKNKAERAFFEHIKVEILNHLRDKKAILERRFKDLK